jgi:GNAT superfamily N-acetyltransferase
MRDAATRVPVRVVDLAPEHEAAYLACLEDWPGSDVLDAGDHNARWLERNRHHGLRVKLALDGAGRPRGMIQYLPIERSPAVGRDLYFILCAWVLPRTPLGGSSQRRGMGTALLAAAEADARALGAKGMAAWGLALPLWMKASWFRRHGYRRADRRGIAALVWKPFAGDATPPAWPPQTGRAPELDARKVVVTACVNGWCPAQNLALERARRAAAPFGDRVELRTVDTCDRKAFLEWGRADALWVDDRLVRTGPPPTEAKLLRLIRRRVARLGARQPPPAPPSSL